MQQNKPKEQKPKPDMAAIKAQKNIKEKALQTGQVVIKGQQNNCHES